MRRTAFQLSWLLLHRLFRDIRTLGGFPGSALDLNIKVALCLGFGLKVHAAQEFLV